MDKPNVILVYTDQQRYDTLGCCGNTIIRTPVLDELARNGCLFHRSYVTTPLCVPSRVSLFTGRYARSTGSYNNDRLMAPEEQDFAALFRQNGYATALIGKDHCFGKTRVEQSFDFVRTAGHCRIDESLSPAATRINGLRKDKMQLPTAEDPVPREDNITASLFRAAADYVSSQAQPFFLWLSIPDPHPPYMVCEPYAGMYKDQTPPPCWREGEMENKPYRQRLIVEWDRYGRDYPDDRILELKQTYWGMVSYIDNECGRLLAALDETGRADDTIVVFTSDHGDYMGDHRMIRKGPHLYDALTHVPLIIRWPSRVAPQETQALVSNIDVLPTLADLAGIVSFDRVEGESFSPALLDKSIKTHRQAVFMEHGDPGSPLQEGELSHRDAARLGASTSHHLCPEIRRGEVKGILRDRWKYCMTPGDVDELYDLDSDPNELVNRANDADVAGVVRERRIQLKEWMQNAGAPPSQ